MDTRTDHELVESARRYQSSEAFNVLVRRHQGRVFSLAYTLLGNGPEAEDMAQEAFLRAYINLHTLREPDKFAPWLRRITVSCCRKQLRRFRPELFRATTLSEEEEQEIEDNGKHAHPVEQVIERERADVVQSAISALPQQYRIAVTLFYLEGMSYEDIAQFMDVTTGTVKSTLNRARKKLKTTLESYIKEATAMMDHLSKEHTLPDDFHKRIEWLTESLRRSGILQSGTVTAIAELPDAPGLEYGFMYDDVKRLNLQYTSDAPSAAPAKMYLKIQSDHEGKDEVNFYQHTTQDMKHLPMVPRCLGSEYSEATGLSYCLIEDITDTHEMVVERYDVVSAGTTIFTRETLENLVTTMAQFHAYWWEDDRLGNEIFYIPYPFRNQEGYDRGVNSHRDNWATAVKIAGDEIPAEWHELYEHALAKVPLLWPHYFRDRFNNRENLTLTNQQYISEFFVPRNPDRDGVVIKELHGHNTNLCTDDLAIMLTSFFTPEQRHEDDLEQHLLRRYHETLIDGGVTDYSRDNLLMDYRVKIIWRIFLSVWDCVTAPPPKRAEPGQTHGTDKSYWWPKMVSEVGAYQDWKCAELLDELG